MRKKFVLFLWKAIAATVVLVILVFIAIWNGWIGYMPDMEDLQNPIDRYATQIYSADGKVIGTWNQDRENRVHVSFDKLSPYIVQALVATEDVRFYEHSGIDFIALSRAIIKRGLLGQTSAGGGSTITQQLAKQLYSGKAHSTFERLLQKPIEWVIAIKLERNFTKEEIVMMYLNQFDFLHNAVGIKTASNTYFSKEPDNLTIEEAAMLIGLCKNPSYFNPVRHEQRCQERRNVVLQQMQKAGYISDSEYAQASAKPLVLKFHRTDHKDGTATYFREFLRRYLMANKPERANYPSWQNVQFTIDSLAWEQDPLYGWCNKNTKKDGTPYNIYKDGLKVFTTIDSRMQQYAEEAVYKHVAKFLQPAFNRENRHKPNAPFTNQLTQKEIKQILNRSIMQSDRWRNMKAAGYSEEEIRASFREKTEMTVFSYNGEIDTIMTPLDSIRYYKSFLRSGFCSMDAKTGAVKAYVGGLDFTHFQYDMVMEGRRQVGSTIKPFLYSLAMENGFTPCDQAPNVQQTYIVAGQPWTPRNASRARYGENVTLKWGLAQSNNWISAYLMSRLDPQQFVQLLHEYGINNPDIHPSMALCLGPCDITVGEMTSAYTAFANHGIRCAPLFVTRIEDSNGQVLAHFEPRVNEVISEESSFKMLTLLQGVVDGGTGSRLRFKYNVNAQMGGKTGTTNRNSDAWFMAVTPDLVSGTWVGGEDRDIHFDSMAMGQGATMALPIYAYFIKKVYANEALPYKANAIFDLPEDFDGCGRAVDDQDDFYGIEDVFE
ncbi:MAG: transglycosylase domain-containing protein [Prevotella sp.]|nr:transglycosylase domain-containing protein [Prevotella sp.]